MNSLELARKVVDCLSDGYDDEENREEAETALYNELSQLDGNSVVKAAQAYVMDNGGLAEFDYIP